MKEKKRKPEFTKVFKGKGLRRGEMVCSQAFCICPLCLHTPRSAKAGGWSGIVAD
jgi:hypothetical protein